MFEINEKWDHNKRRDEAQLLQELIQRTDLSTAERARIEAHGAHLVRNLRTHAKPAIMELFLAEYGLSSDEGVALMCLAEALLRVPDAKTIDKLIKDKIAPSDWSAHLGHSASPLINVSTWGLFLTGRVLDKPHSSLLSTLQSMITRLGEPVIRTAVSTAMRELGRQFVLGQDIGAALKRAAKNEQKGYCYSYDMLGEAALTAKDAQRYARAYSDAIAAISAVCTNGSVDQNPGISVKLSALHPRYEVAQTKRVMAELVPVVRQLARQAKEAGMGLNIDAEEADRLALSMAVIEELMSDPALHGWDGFGVVVQAYGRRAVDIIDGLYEMAERYDRRIMVRLVKGAYWDTEIKHAQVEGLSDFPVFTRKSATDVSYLASARALLGKSDRIYPQFATHNAHTVAAVLEMAKLENVQQFEFQRLHGMGEALHAAVKEENNTRCRIYAPVGPYRDLLAYLVRRLLENGANSSFVNQIVDHAVPVETIVACPLSKVEAHLNTWQSPIVPAPALFGPNRVNAMGFDMHDSTVLNAIMAEHRASLHQEVCSLLVATPEGCEKEPVLNPATGQHVGTQVLANEADVRAAFDAAQVWSDEREKRQNILCKAADIYEEHYAEIFALLTAEAGKTLADAVAELREAVDFLRYYAFEARHHADHAPRGTIAAISPWNFPLAIFTGQIAAALATGNAVIAKPAETTPMIAALAVRLLHEAGVPKSALQLVLGYGGDVGQALCSDPRLGAVVFTGSTQTAKHIQQNLALHAKPGTPLIAETGGLNAMIVDSTALPEQAIGDIIASAFQSAGQRCSALRCLYVQKDVMKPFLDMLMGAMDELIVGNPEQIETDVGPVITAKACQDISTYVQKANEDGRLLHQVAAPNEGHFVAPALIRVDGIGDLTHEVFGPVLHIASFEAHEIDEVIADINATGFGLTFGLHTRIDERVQEVCDQVRCGNLYVNRNQIGAIVGSQPFGGEGLSGTGPKAGGPHYLARFCKQAARAVENEHEQYATLQEVHAAVMEAQSINTVIGKQILPGPTGEFNALSLSPRAPILCLGPGAAACEEQVKAITELGGQAVALPQNISADVLQNLTHLGGVIWWGAEDRARSYATALAERSGPIIPLITDYPDKAHALFERHLCVDTTAAGGNTDLLSGNESIAPSLSSAKIHEVARNENVFDEEAL